MDMENIPMMRPQLMLLPASDVHEEEKEAPQENRS